jgi:hypothetical protein
MWQELDYFNDLADWASLNRVLLPAGAVARQ